MTVADRITRAKNDMDEVYAAGKEAYESDWWDTFQKKGTRTGYRNGFTSFPAELFFPKYDIVSSAAVHEMFRTFPVSAGSNPESKSLDLVARLQECGVKIDFSNATAENSAFYFAAVTTVPELDFSNCAYLLNTFYGCHFLRRIEKLKLSESGTTSFNDVFIDCVKLQTIRIGGKIGRSISFSVSPLDLESAVNVISALLDYSGTESGGKYTVTFSAHTKELLDGAGTIFGNGKTWREYVASLGWNA